MVRMTRVGVVSALLVACASPLAAQQVPMGRGGRAMRPRLAALQAQVAEMREMMDMMLPIQAWMPADLLSHKDQLALTADQVSRLQGLADDMKQAKEHAKADHDAHHAALMRLFDQPVPDPAQVTQHTQAAMQAMQAGCVAEHVAAAKAKGLLTPEQRARVDGRVDALREMRGRGMGPMPAMPRDSAGRGHEGH